MWERVDCQQLTRPQYPDNCWSAGYQWCIPSPASISHFKAAAPIRLIEGGVVFPKNLGLGLPRKGKESSSESEAPRSSLGPLMIGGTCELISPGPSMMSGSSTCWTVAWP